MNHSDFKIGTHFRTAAGEFLWRCTDVGTRTIIAIRIDRVDVEGTRPPRTLTGEEAAKQGWFNGPPYAVAESVFDEYDLPGCEPDEDHSA